MVLLVLGLSFSCSKKEEGEMPDTDRVLLQTNMGDILIQLNEEKAPISVENFKAYVKAGFYDGTIFHRITRPDEHGNGIAIIQAGGIDESFQPKAAIRNPIPNEAANGLSNVRGTIAYGRRQAPNSATSHFYINVTDNTGLDHNEDSFGYAVFGRVTEGMEVVDKIDALSTRPGTEIPERTVKIKKAKMVK